MTWKTGVTVVLFGDCLSCYGCREAAQEMIHQTMEMNCPWGTRVSLRKIAFGSKADPSCPLETDFFTPLTCCIPECGDCLVEDTGFHKHILQQSACEGKTGCSVRAQRSSIAECGPKPFTNYMVVMYECVPDSDILADHMPLYSSSVKEELCGSLRWRQSQQLVSRGNTTGAPARSTAPPPATVNSSTTLTGAVPPDVAREGAIIGALVGGATLLIAVVLFIVICCCLRWRSEEEEDIENKSNLSFIDPLTLQPSYHAFGSVDGSSMAEQVHSDNLSMWSASTDQYSSVRMTQHQPEDSPVAQGRWYENQMATPDGFAPSKPVPFPRTVRVDSNAGIEAKRPSQSGRDSRKHWNISIVARRERGMRKSKSRSSKSRDRADPNSVANCKRPAKDSYYKGKALALKELTVSQFHREVTSEPASAVGPMTGSRGLSSWWLLNAMRSGSEPITRFQQRTENGQHFGRIGNRHKMYM